MKTLSESLQRVLLLTTILVLPLGQLARIQLTPRVAVYFHDFLITLLFINWAAHKLFFKQKLHFTKFYWWPISFVIIGTISLALNHSQFQSNLLVASLHLFRFANLSLLLLITFDLTRHKVIKTDLKRLLLFASLTIAILGLFQYIFIPDTRFLLFLGWDEHLNRLISTLLDPAFTGAILLLGLILVETNKKTHPFLFSLLFIPLMLTYSRATFAATLVAFVILAFKKHSLSYFFKRLLILLLIIILLPRTQGEGVKLERTHSITSRIQSGTNALDIIAQNPVFGVGFNNYKQAANLQSGSYLNHVNSPDNSFLLILATTGIVGLSVYLFWLFRLILWSHAHSKVLLVSLLAISAHAFTNNSLFYPFILIWLWILIGHELATTSNS